jgi:hypothetical protein
VRKSPHFPGIFSLDQLVSVSKARRILGTLADNLSDDQVKELLHTLHLLAREQLWYNGSKEEMSSHESNTINEP